MATLETTVGWVSLAEAIELWPEAPGEEHDGYAILVSLLSGAHETLEGRAAPLEPPPVRYQLAQVYVAMHLWSRQQAGNSADLGPDGMALNTYQLVLQAFDLVRRPGFTSAGLRGIR